MKGSVDAMKEPAAETTMCKLPHSDDWCVKEKIVEIFSSERFLVWVSSFLLVICIWAVFSSAEFSFMLTINAIMRAFSLFTILVDIEVAESTRGVSRKMSEIFIIIFGCRVCAVLPFDGYLPYDASGDFCYRAIECFGLLVSCSLLFYLDSSPPESYDVAKDSANHVILAAIAFACAIVFHSDLNDNLPSDVAWAFSHYLEPVALICQFQMSNLLDMEPSFIGSFLAAQILSAALSISFWLSCFGQLSKTSPMVGNWFILTQVLHLALLIYFRIRPQSCKPLTPSRAWKLGQIV